MTESNDDLELEIKNDKDKDQEKEKQILANYYDNKKLLLRTNVKLNSSGDSLSSSSSQNIKHLFNYTSDGSNCSLHSNEEQNLLIDNITDINANHSIDVQNDKIGDSLDKTVSGDSLHLTQPISDVGLIVPLLNMEKSDAKLPNDSNVSVEDSSFAIGPICTPLLYSKPMVVNMPPKFSSSAICSITQDGSSHNTLRNINSCTPNPGWANNANHTTTLNSNKSTVSTIHKTQIPKIASPPLSECHQTSFVDLLNKSNNTAPKNEKKLKCNNNINNNDDNSVYIDMIDDGVDDDDNVIYKNENNKIQNASCSSSGSSLLLDISCNKLNNNLTNVLTDESNRNVNHGIRNQDTKNSSVDIPSLSSTKNLHFNSENSDNKNSTEPQTNLVSNINYIAKNDGGGGEGLPLHKTKSDGIRSSHMNFNTQILLTKKCIENHLNEAKKNTNDMKNNSIINADDPLPFNVLSSPASNNERMPPTTMFSPSQHLIRTKAQLYSSPSQFYSKNTLINNNINKKYSTDSLKQLSEAMPDRDPYYYPESIKASKISYNPLVNENENITTEIVENDMDRSIYKGLNGNTSCSTRHFKENSSIYAQNTEGKNNNVNDDHNNLNKIDAKKKKSHKNKKKNLVSSSNNDMETANILHNKDHSNNYNSYGSCNINLSSNRPVLYSPQEEISKPATYNYNRNSNLQQMAEKRLRKQKKSKVKNEYSITEPVISISDIDEHVNFIEHGVLTTASNKSTTIKTSHNKQHGNTATTNPTSNKLQNIGTTLPTKTSHNNPKNQITNNNNNNNNKSKKISTHPNNSDHDFQQLATTKVPNSDIALKSVTKENINGEQSKLMLDKDLPLISSNKQQNLQQINSVSQKLLPDDEDDSIAQSVVMSSTTTEYEHENEILDPYYILDNDDSIPLSPSHTKFQVVTKKHHRNHHKSPTLSQKPTSYNKFSGEVSSTGNITSQHVHKKLIISEETKSTGQVKNLTKSKNHQHNVNDILNSTGYNNNNNSKKANSNTLSSTLNHNINNINNNNQKFVDTKLQKQNISAREIMNAPQAITNRNNKKQNIKPSTKQIHNNNNNSNNLNDQIIKNNSTQNAIPIESLTDFPALGTNAAQINIKPIVSQNHETVYAKKRTISPSTKLKTTLWNNDDDVDSDTKNMPVVFLCPTLMPQNSTNGLTFDFIHNDCELGSDNSSNLSENTSNNINKMDPGMKDLQNVPTSLHNNFEKNVNIDYKSQQIKQKFLKSSPKSIEDTTISAPLYDFIDHSTQYDTCDNLNIQQQDDVYTDALCTDKLSKDTSNDESEALYKLAVYFNKFWHNYLKTRNVENEP